MCWNCHLSLSNICLSTGACKHIDYWCCIAIYQLFVGKLTIVWMGEKLQQTLGVLFPWLHFPHLKCPFKWNQAWLGQAGWEECSCVGPVWSLTNGSAFAIVCWLFLILARTFFTCMTGNNFPCTCVFQTIKQSSVCLPFSLLTVEKERKKSRKLGDPTSANGAGHTTKTRAADARQRADLGRRPTLVHQGL